MEFLGADTNLGTKSELGSIGERGGRVGIDTGGIHEAQEAVGRSLIFGDDAFAMLGAVEAYMFKGGVQRGHSLDSHGVRKELGAETFRGGGFQQLCRISSLQCRICRLIGINEHMAFG